MYKNVMKIGLCLCVLNMFLFLRCGIIVAEQNSSTIKVIDNFSCLTINRASGEIVVLTSGDSDNVDFSARSFLIDGKNNDEIDLIVKNIETNDDTLKIQKESDEGLVLTEQINTSADKVSYILKIANKGAKQRWIEPGFRIKGTAENMWEFWDGCKVNKVGANYNHFRDDLIGTFPASAVYTDSSGVAIGIEPMQLLSYLKSSLVSEDGKEICFEYSTRVVVDPQETVKVEYIIFTFNPRFGYLDAIQKVYDIYPSVFRPNPDIDSRVSLNSAQYHVYHDNNKEIAQKVLAGWDWGYAPFKRSGEIYGRPEFWEYKPTKPIPIADKHYLGTPEDFYQYRKNKFINQVNCDVPIMFYIPSGIWCEHQLAEQEYPEAMVSEKGAICFINAPWVRSYDSDCRLFPYGNKYAEVLRQDMYRVAEELDLKGFAFDVADGGVRVHETNTKGVEQVPIRAYDDGGAFVDDGIAIALLMDYAHSLRTREGKPLAVVSNPVPSAVYPIIFRSDTAMYENVPWTLIQDYGPETLRYRLGHKTMVWWKNWDFQIDQHIDINKLTEAEYEEVFSGLEDFVILKSLSMGAFPAGQYLYDRPSGIQRAPKLEKVLPLLKQLIEAGWQAVPAMIPEPKSLPGNGDIWLSRYGDGLQSFLVIGNASCEEFTGEIKIFNEYLGDYNYLFSNIDGGITENKIVNRNTFIKASIHSRNYLVTNTLLGIKTEEEILRAIVQEENDNQKKTKVVFGLGKQTKAEFILNIPKGYSVQAVYLNGEMVNAKERTQTLTFKELIKNKDELLIIWK